MKIIYFLEFFWIIFVFIKLFLIGDKCIYFMLFGALKS